MKFVLSRKYGSREAETKTKNAYDNNKRIATESVGLAGQLRKIEMAKSKSLTVLTVMSSIFALQACSEGITSAEEALSNLSNQTSSEATDPPEISIGAANPTGIETTIPVTPSVISNYIVNNISVLPVSSSPSIPDEELEPGLAPDTDTPPETDFEVVTDTLTETDSEVVTDTPPETDSEVITDTPPETDSEVVTDTPPETKDKEVVSVEYAPTLEAPAEGELVPYGSTIQFAWSIPVALFGTVTGFDIAIADASEGVFSYRNNVATISSCSDDGLCTHEINSADIPIPEGDNIWSVSSLGNDVSFNIAEATFSLDKDPVVEIASDLSLLSPAADYIADSSSVNFSWEDPSKPDAAYDLHVYNDAARTQKVTGTNGVIFDTNYIGTATSHTFTHDPSNGAKRYGKLIQFVDDTYELWTGQEVLFEYTANTSQIIDPSSKTGGEDYDYIKSLVDAEFAVLATRYKSMPMNTADGYFSQPILVGGAQAFRASGDTSYLTTPLRIGQQWIDSGNDENGDGILDWWGWRDFGCGAVINYGHHEFKAASGIADVLTELIRTNSDGGVSGRRSAWANFLKTHSWEKWTFPQHLDTQKSICQDSGDQISTDGRSTNSTTSLGRWTLIAIALDKAQAAGFIPSTNEYRKYLESPSQDVYAGGGNVGRFFPKYLNKYGLGRYTMDASVQGDGTKTFDTSHNSEWVYSVLRAAQTGYNIGGKRDEFLTFYQDHLNSKWFPTNAGFTAHSDGTGDPNSWHDSSITGQTLGANLNPDLRARYVYLFRNNKPTWTFWDSSGHNRESAVMAGGSLMWALAGNTL